MIGDGDFSYPHRNKCEHLKFLFLRFRFSHPAISGMWDKLKSIVQIKIVNGISTKTTKR